MLRYALPLLVLLCAPLHPAQAQTGQIRGVVNDAATGEPLPGATIAVVDAALGTLSDESGRYVLDLPPGTYVLQFSFIGYAIQRPESVIVQANSVVSLAIALHPQAIALSEMTITPGRFAIMGDATG